MHHFTKAGSGQTWGKHSEKRDDAFLQGRFADSVSCTRRPVPLAGDDVWDPVVTDPVRKNPKPCLLLFQYWYSFLMLSPEPAW